MEVGLQKGTTQCPTLNQRSYFTPNFIPTGSTLVVVHCFMGRAETSHSAGGSYRISILLTAFQATDSKMFKFYFKSFLLIYFLHPAVFSQHVCMFVIVSQKKKIQTKIGKLRPAQRWCCVLYTYFFNLCLGFNDPNAFFTILTNHTSTMGQRLLFYA